MVWVFAVLVVLAMGGIALVAAGRGAPMVEEYDDRPDALVPSEGPLRAADLRQVRFSLAFRGYRMSEVDALLDRLAAEREEVERQRAWAEDPDSHTDTESATDESAAPGAKGMPVLPDGPESR